MKRQCGVLSLQLLSAATVAQGSAVVDASLQKEEQRRIAANDTRDLKVFLELDQPDTVATAVGKDPMRERIGCRCN